VKTLSLDLRERIVTAYDQQEGTREAVARRFRVSLGMVKKLLQQRRRTGHIGSRHHYSGRKPMILASHRAQLRKLLDQKPDLTLQELRDATGLTCSLPAIHYVLQKLELTYKKRRCTPVSKPGPILRVPDGHGGGSSPVWILPAWSSSMKRVRKQT
jgi:transposase